MEGNTRPSRDFKLKPSWGNKTFSPKKKNKKANKKNAIYQPKKAELSKEGAMDLRILVLLFSEIGFQEYVHFSWQVPSYSELRTVRGHYVRLSEYLLE